MAKRENEKMKVVYSPTFMEDFAKNIPEEEREEVWEEVQKALKKLEDNPYWGTPLQVGYHVVLWNFIKRVLWRLGIKI